MIADRTEAARAGANGALIHNATLVIVIIALILGAISVTNTMAMSVLERQGELALLSTVGWSNPRIAALVVGEGVGVSVLGAALGLLLGVLGSLLLVDLMGVGAYVSPSVTAWGLGRGLLVGVTDRRARRPLPGLAGHADDAAARSGAGGLSTPSTTVSMRSARSPTCAS